MPALSFVADVQDSSWGGRGSPGKRRSPRSFRRRRSPSARQQQLQQQQQQVPVHNKQRQRNARERSGTNENSPIRKETIYRETHGECARSRWKRSVRLVSSVSALTDVLASCVTSRNSVFSFFPNYRAVIVFRVFKTSVDKNVNTKKKKKNF